jgi:hypothetical protein
MKMTVALPLRGPDPPYGTTAWIVLKRAEFLSVFHATRWRRDVAEALYTSIRDSEAWRLLKNMRQQPFRSFDDFCADGNGFRMRREHIERRLTLAQALAQEDGVPELAFPGGDRTKADEQASIRSLPSHGTTAAYLVARLKRDAPEYAQRLANREFRSARAAALAAGIIKPVTPLDDLLRVWKRASEEERAAFLREIND